MTKTRNKKLNFGQKILLEVIWLLCRFVSILPHWFKYYIFAEVVYFLIYRCLRYRVAVTNKNLRNSFPELSDEERAKIRKAYYHYLSEVMVSTISLAGGHPQRSIILQNSENTPLAELKAKTDGKSWVALTAHYGLWEYLMFWAEYSDQAMIAVYHKLGSDVFDALFKRLRNHKNVHTVAAKETVRFCMEHKEGIDGKNYLIGLIADQNPPHRPNSQWFKFLNQDTIFFDGGEKLALKLGLPVYFIYQRRISRGLYELNYELIHDGVESVEPYEITRRYIEKLERVIRQEPSLWLWSHRRWKHNPNKWKQKEQ